MRIFLWWPGCDDSTKTPSAVHTAKRPSPETFICFSLSTLCTWDNQKCSLEVREVSLIFFSVPILLKDHKEVSSFCHRLRWNLPTSAAGGAEFSFVSQILRWLFNSSSIPVEGVKRREQPTEDTRTLRGSTRIRERQAQQWQTPRFCTSTG